MSWSTIEPVFNDYYKTQVEWEKINGEQKINLRNKLVAFAKKGEEEDVSECKHYGLTHTGRCTNQEIVQKYDQETLFV